MTRRLLSAVCAARQPSASTRRTPALHAASFHRSHWSRYRVQSTFKRPSSGNRSASGLISVARASALVALLEPFRILGAARARTTPAAPRRPAGSRALPRSSSRPGRSRRCGPRPGRARRAAALARRHSSMFRWVTRGLCHSTTSLSSPHSTWVSIRSQSSSLASSAAISRRLRGGALILSSSSSLRSSSSSRPLSR